VEKNSVLAIVLSIAVIIVLTVIQGILHPPKQVEPPPVEQTNVPSPAEVPESSYVPMQSTPTDSQPPAVSGLSITDASGGPQYEEPVTIETDLMVVTLSSAGGDIVSLKLRQHKEKDDFVEMILPGNSPAHAFTIAFGGLNAQPVSSFFYVNRIFDHTNRISAVEFYRDFFIPASQGQDAVQFRLTKRYDFKPGEYMFELTVSLAPLDGGSSIPGFNFGGSAYVLSFGPQIGPRFEKLDNRYDYRQYVTYTNGKRKMEKANDAIINTSPKWAAICGKYFAFIAIPLFAQYEMNFSEKSEPGLSSASRMNIIRPPIKTFSTEDKYLFYLGPKSQDILKAYNTGNNEFRIRDMQLIEVSNTRGILSPLEKGLKWLLQLFYKLVRNYGVAIILLTLFVKILFFPLTKKSSEATLRMQSVAPKIKELQEKYKDNRQKMNEAMAELYKKEGYNPLSGCLPMLLQIPIFFAMYNLFNNHFDLRGAMFIPGWIPDLSLPEAIWNFPEGFKLPLLGWSALRPLPFIYLGSQLLYGKVTQTPDQQSNTQMKMMLYVMPIVFFFVLYNVPSGLLIYWIFSNVLTMVQQVAINKYLAPKRAAMKAAEEASAAAAPQKKKKKG
jgi:YidC/Oxa1 family membrane protein insertase